MQEVKAVRLARDRDRKCVQVRKKAMLASDWLTKGKGDSDG